MRRTTESAVLVRWRGVGWGEVLLAVAATVLLLQLFPGPGVMLLSAARWVAVSVAGIGGSALSVIDVRNWHWTWIARAVVWNGLWAFVEFLDVRYWPWTRGVVASIVAIVALVGMKAWRDR